MEDNKYAVVIGAANIESAQHGMNPKKNGIFLL